jgi:hypothetical protein
MTVDASRLHPDDVAQRDALLGMAREVLAAYESGEGRG